MPKLIPGATRLDNAMVDRSLARSRSQAHTLIKNSSVSVNGAIVTKPSFPVGAEDNVHVGGDEKVWAGRGAFKLYGALDELKIDVAGLRCLDAGASTGGFTDVLLRGGARTVIAADIGTGQLDPTLAGDDRVIVRDKVNVRNLSSMDIEGPVDLTVADLSFISLTTVLPALIECTKPEGTLLPMIKPQFEVGKDRLGSGGVVKNENLRIEAVKHVLDAAAALGWFPRKVVRSALPGPSGNVEFFAELHNGGVPADYNQIAAWMSTAL